MGASSSTNLAREAQVVSNSVLQQASNLCSFACTSEENGEVVIIGPGAKTGNITFTERCNITDSECSMKTLLDTSIATILAAAAKTTNSTTTGFPDFNYTETDNNVQIQQYIRSSIAQIISNTCQYDAEQTIDNNFVYVGSGATTGDISFNIDSNIAGNCIMDVTAKATVYNKASSTVTESNTITNMWVLIFLVIIVAIVVFGIVLIVFIATGGVSTVASKISGGAGGAGGAGGGTDYASLLKSVQGGPSTGGAATAKTGGSLSKVGGLSSMPSIASKTSGGTFSSALNFIKSNPGMI